jgi:uncharacterized protein YndB with AHSA1/START domain
MSNAVQKGTQQVYRVFIKAKAQTIWDAITKPEWTERYGYACRMEVQLRPGGAFKAFASEPMKAYGSPDVIIVGEVLESDRPRKLVQTWHPIWSPESSAEVPTRLTYLIDEQPNGTCRLTVVHDLAGAPSLVPMVNGENEQAGGGWSYVLSDLKTLLETGRALAA